MVKATGATFSANFSGLSFVHCEANNTAVDQIHSIGEVVVTDGPCNVISINYKKNLGSPAGTGVILCFYLSAVNPLLFC